MPRFFVLTALLVLLAILAPFLFPWPFAFFLGVLAAVFFPPVAILSGVLLDVLYFNGTAGILAHGSLPYFTILGFIVAVLALLVQQFVKTRIMS